jgi:uncharacterized protein
VSDGGAPIHADDRIANLDTVRGVATLGILAMNAVSFGLPAPAYFNIDYAGSPTQLDQAVGIIGEVFIDQKAMALFSLLFGAGIVLFADRAEQHGRRPVLLSLWRNLLLFGIGLVHAAFWLGDVLTLYALCSPILLLLRKRSGRTLFITGAACLAVSALWMTGTQMVIDPSADLGDYWLNERVSMSDPVELAFIVDVGGRGLGMMLIGVALFRTEIVQGTRPAAFYRRLALGGLGLGLPLSIAGVVIHSSNNWNGDVALIGAVPNILATAPLAISYMALITLWNQRRATWLHERVRAVGRMALTNYLTQTVLGLLVLDGIFEFGTLGRTQLLLFVVGVWTVQLAWSRPWLSRFCFGPVEWMWRVATYRRLQPIRR